MLWDLNPLVETFISAETWKGDIDEKMFEIDFNYPKKFIPSWSKLDYWHPREFVEVLSTLWGFYHDHPSPLLAIPLLKITKYFSYAEMEFPKLYKSKVAKERVERLLSSRWRETMKDMYWKEVDIVIRKVREFQSLHPHEVSGVVKGGVDVLASEPPQVDAVITSPPYLQAQEYVRTFKLELFWMGFTEETVRNLSKMEIPYNNPPEVKVQGRTYYDFLEKVKKMNHQGLLKIYTTYFSSLLYFFSRVKAKKLGIFVGQVKMRDVRIPIDEILKEHLESVGWAHEKTYIDTIVNRRLKKMEVNPATKMKDERTPKEHLLIMTK
ncbi:cytosine methylase [Sulfuracidifex tepidarius]|uniref:Uncharacterized protein n=1 Tax=Sulfuracidifex tepidarius TaxID=1294262 RepID=A0A510E0D6_9CREN|nr:cytosine methylase [Sulfuracidifex tepidarius]BBG25956.1 hypothetical protein IC007_0461 [Sulfuracidifex tepidarius]